MIFSAILAAAGALALYLTAYIAVAAWPEHGAVAVISGICGAIALSAGIAQLRDDRRDDYQEPGTLDYSQACTCKESQPTEEANHA